MAMKEKLKKLGKKALILLIIIVIVIVAILVSYQFMYNFSPKINDYTSKSETESYNEEIQKIKDANNNVAVLAYGVEIFIEEAADEINDSIEQVEELSNGNVQTTFNNNVDERIKDLSKGEIFYLEGEEGDNFPQGLLGKVVSNTENDETTTIVTESPKVDEIFDMLELDISEELTSENLQSITPMEGVTITGINDNETVAKRLTEGALMEESELEQIQKNNINTNQSNNNQAYVQQLTNLNFETEKLAQVEDNSMTEQFKVEADFSDMLQEIAKAKLDGKVDEEILENLYLKINLEANFKHLGVNSKIDFELSGLHDLYFDIEKDISAKSTIESGVEFEVEKEATSIGADEIIELCGLDKKMFPLFYIDIGTKKMLTLFSGKDMSDSINNLNAAMPISVGVIVYVDFEGNVKVGLSVEGSYESRTGNRLAIVEDDEWKFSNEELYNEEKVTVSLNGEIAASADLNTGIDVLLNISSANIADLALVKLGIQAEAKATLTASIERTNAGVDASHEETLDGHIRLYLKILDLDVKFKLKNEFIPISVQRSFTLLDITLLELGKKPETFYNEETMQIGQVSAEDAEYNYYKTIYGTLIKESKDDKYKETIYTKGFDQFCAIDESYIYVTVPSDSGTFDVVKIDKDDDNLYRTVIENVTYVLTEDDEYIYYLLDGEETIIYRYKRDNGENEQFMQFEHNVQLMLKQDDGSFYIVTQEDSMVLAFFGEATNYYYVVGKDKNIISDYGSEPTVEQYFTADIGNYYVAQKYYANGRARPTATEIIFINKDKSKQVQTETSSGWKNTDLGIVAEHEAENGGYNMVIYSQPNGELRTITNVQSRYAMFTLVESDSGEWYFFDQEGTEVVLYKMDSNMSNKTVVKRFTNESFRCNMENCSMETTDNVLYFYEIESDDTEVLYRYDLN